MTGSKLRAATIGTWVCYGSICFGIAGLIWMCLHTHPFGLVIFVAVWAVISIAALDTITSLRIEHEMLTLRLEYRRTIDAAPGITPLACASCQAPVESTHSRGFRIHHQPSCPERARHAAYTFAPTGVETTSVGRRFIAPELTTFDKNR